MTNFQNGIKKSILLLVLVLSFITATITPALAAVTSKPFDGKKISILGDSISSFSNISNGTSSQTTNSTIKNNLAYYKPGKADVDLADTWWMQVIDELGGELLVNNSYSGSTVLGSEKGYGEATYLNRCINLHDNTGENSGEKPDVIIIYLGINDFSFNYTKLGSYNSINFKNLISFKNGKAVYSTPVTACEAYAIMLHKIKTAYPDAEIYCMNFHQRNGLETKYKPAFREYSNNISEIINHMNCTLIDLYSESGMNTENTANNLYLIDKIHPNRNGMDAITNAFISAFYKNSSNNNPTYTINYSVDENIIADQGLLKVIPSQDEFNCNFTSYNGAPVDISVLSDGVDVTDKYVSYDNVSIPCVQGNIQINASLAQSTDTHSYEITGSSNTLTFTDSDEYDENALNQHSGYTEGGVLKNTVLSTGKTICLKPENEWSFLWRGSTESTDTPYLGFYNYVSATKEGNRFIRLDSQAQRLSVCQYNDGNLYECGIDLKDCGIDYNTPHTYKLKNEINANNYSTVHLYIDGKDMGDLSSYYINGKLQNCSPDTFDIKDIYINHIGSEGAPVNGWRIDYVRIWEKDIPSTHQHHMAYDVSYSLSCTKDECTQKVCDCGYHIDTIITKAPGHTESGWLTEYVATADAPGLKFKKCTKCNEITSQQVIPQLRPATPELYGISNRNTGIKIGWYSVTGADYYRIYKRGAGESWKLLCTITADKTTYVDTTAKNNAYWRYTVRAVNEAGFSGYESGMYIKRVSSPHIYSLSNVENGIKLSWKAISGAKTYRVYRNRLGYSNWIYLGDTSSTTYIDKDIKNANGVYYRYTVRAINSYYSDYEATKSYIKRLSNPKLLKAVSLRDGIHITWDTVLGASEYYVYRRTANSTWSKIAVVKGENAKTYTDTTAKKGITYTYTVRAVYKNQISSYYPKGLTCKDKY